jgi:hypothetical protein
MRVRLTRLSLMAVATALASPAFAQQGDTPVAGATQAVRTTSYDAAFFAASAPRTALDIARRVPGFALDLGNQDTRGFAGAAGNVVINGARPSSKAESIETTLSRIPARSVVRVEVGPGDLYGADYSGKNQVLNVILSGDAGVDGNVTVSARRLYSGKIVPNLSGSALIKRGASSINLSAGTERYDQVEEGTDTLTDLDTGEPIELRRKVNRYNDRAPYVSGSWALERTATNSLRLNARFSPGKFFLTQANHVVPVGDEERDDRLVQDFKNPVIELGGDITRSLAGGAIKLVGLATRRKRDNSESYFFRPDGVNVVGGFEQLQDAQRNETLAKLSWSRPNLAGFSFEIGAEGVLNTLDSKVELFEFGEDGSRTRIDLPIDDATVKERRAEAFVNAGRQLSKKLRVDAGLNMEFSQLKVRGDANADRTLKFLKPSLTLDWKPSGAWHSQLSIRRTVAQLDFYDFISVAELSNDRVNGGNADLLPQRAWEVRATVDHPILGDGLAKLELGHDHISLLQDRILTDEGFDAPGNIGTGRRSFARLTLDAPLAKLGLTGARLKLNGELQRTRVDDPISGEPRSFSGQYTDWQWSVDYRQDRGALSYGFVLSDRAEFTFFRTNEFDTNRNGGPYATAFVEYRPSPRTTVTFDVDNLINTRAQRERLLFFPNRRDIGSSIREFRERNRHVTFGLTFKRSFGGARGGVAPAGSPS